MNTVYYRGFLRSCNYNCSYCPFRLSRNETSEADLLRDQNGLKRFCGKAPDLGNKLSVMFVPYGESLIHQYYQKAIAGLCETDVINKVGCQTNLGFSIRDFLACFDSDSDYRSKLRLWCSFHPSQSSLDSFLEKCMELYKNGIIFSVGAVGICKNIELLTQLRKCLPEQIYLWINAMEGSRIKYTRSDIDRFLAIDPLFFHELAEYPADSGFCLGGKESIFVEGNGDVFACVISRKKLGNIYRDPCDSLLNVPEKCRAAKCHCYLAYSNRTDVFNVNDLNAERAFRIHSCKKEPAGFIQSHISM